MPDNLSDDIGANYPVYPIDIGQDEIYLARIGYPAIGDSRIWVKRPDNVTTVKVFDPSGQEISPDYSEPRFRTATYSFPEDISKVRVHFFDERGQEQAVKSLYPKSTHWLFNPNGEYSVAFYGCYEPFDVPEGEHPKAVIFESESGVDAEFSSKLEQYFLNQAVGATVESDLLPNLRLVVGTGDQVYVDAGYENTKAGAHHPISAWSSDHPPLPLRNPALHKIHIDKMYSAAYSFERMNQVFAQVPQVNVWDDHEIRDGWGSQGDEYSPSCSASDGSCKPVKDLWDGYFMPAKRGYLAHQVNVGPNPVTDGDREFEAIPQMFQVGALSGFAFDLRSLRNRHAGIVAGRDQIETFRAWADKHRNEPVIIISSMPLFLKNLELAEKFGRFSDLSDDIADGWAAKHNQVERDEILRIAIETNIKPIIVSGDYHKAGLSEIHLIDKDCLSKDPDGDCSTVWGYELLTTGFHHSGLATSYKAKVFRKVESQNLGKQYINLADSNGHQYSFDPHIMKSVVAQNFGGLTVGEDGSIKIKLVTANERPGKELDIYSFTARWGHEVNNCTLGRSPKGVCDILRSPSKWNQVSDILNVFRPLKYKKLFVVPGPGMTLEKKEESLPALF